MTSTSFPRTAGRPRSTRIATSSPARRDAIIPVAAQPKTSRLTSPRARGRRRQLLDRARDVGPAALGEWKRVDDLADDVVAKAVVAKHDSEDRDEHDRQRHEREEDAVGDPGGVLAASVGEVAVDRLGNDPGERADELERPTRETDRPRGRSASGRGPRPFPKSRRAPGTTSPVPGTLPAAPSPVAQLAEHSAVNRRVVGSSPTRGAPDATVSCGKREGRLSQRPLGSGYSSTANIRASASRPTTLAVSWDKTAAIHPVEVRPLPTALHAPPTNARGGRPPHCDVCDGREQLLEVGRR